MIVDARPGRLVAFVAELERTGMLRSAQWASAFGSVLRHAFLPRCFEEAYDEDRRSIVWQLRDASDKERWLQAVYQDKALITALDPDTAQQVGERTWMGEPVCSSTQPSVMAGMLEALDIHDGQRILEIGTGTGYTAALLCHRLGDRQVHSIDVDPALTEAARDRLAPLGYIPNLAAGNGYTGYPTHHRFDAIIATCSAPTIPAAWLEQTRPGGRIVADLATGIEGGIVCLTVRSAHRARGFFTGVTGRLMRARSAVRAHTSPAVFGPEAGVYRSAVTAADIRTHYGFRLLLAFTLPTCDLTYHVDSSGVPALELRHPNGTWAHAPLSDTGSGLIAYGGYGGSPDLWREVECAWRWWTDHGRPDQRHFAISREADGGLYAWHLPDGRRWLVSA